MNVPYPNIAPNDLITQTSFIIYIISALVFFSEVFGEATGYRIYRYSWEAHEIIEPLTVIGFIVGMVLLWRSHVQMNKRNSEMETLLNAARGEFQQMLQSQFNHWNFTEAEKDIALLTVKGMTVSEIAQLRKTSEGTVKSQNSSIYRKAGVNSRTQLLGALIEEFLI